MDHPTTATSRWVNKQVALHRFAVVDTSRLIALLELAGHRIAVRIVPSRESCLVTHACFFSSRSARSSAPTPPDLHPLNFGDTSLHRLHPPIPALGLVPPFSTLLEHLVNPEEFGHYGRRWAMVCMTMGEVMHALQVLNKIVDLYPSDWRNWHARGLYHFSMRNYGKAREDLTEAYTKGGGSASRDMLARLPDDDERPPPNFRGFPRQPPPAPETRQ